MRSAPLQIALISLVFAACGPEENTCEETEFIPNSDTTLTAMTYNTGLGPGLVRYATPRTPEVISALADEPFDLLCLQEVWLQEDSDAIASMFEDRGLHVLRTDTRGENETGTDTCKPGSLDGVKACVAQECAGWADEDVSLCAVKSCTDELKELLRKDLPCLVCVATSPGKSAEQVETDCVAKGSSRIHEGGNGVILVSRYPLTRAETFRMEASFANRVAQMARVELPTGPLEVACTHISANQALPPLQSDYGWWTDEKEGQILEISGRLEERADCVPQLFMGDMNTSRDNGDLIESSRSVFDLAESEGFTSPAATWSPPVCSSCAENTNKSSDGPSRLIDHVMYRAYDVTRFEAVSVERTLDWTVPVEDRGMPLDTSLSDHFGIRVTFDISTR